MMQVSTIYAHSLERQFVSRRSQILHNISLTCSVDQKQQQASSQAAEGRANDLDLSEAGIIPPEISASEEDSRGKSHQFSTSVDQLYTGDGDKVDSSISSNLSFSETDIKLATVEIDAKEFTDRLCKLPSQCRGGHILGSPRRHSTSSISSTVPRLCQSAGQLNLSSDLSLMKSYNGKKALTMGASEKPPPNCGTNKKVSKVKTKDKKDAKKLPSNFMYLGTWSTRQNSERLLEQVKSGDVLEFNIKFHHHWGIALVNKNKKPTLENLELIHLHKDKDSNQRAVKETLAQYWVEGVTARINNSRDVHKPPLSASDVISTSLKIVSQPYRIWQNSEQLITHCRYGEGVRSRQLSDSARWSSLSKCVGLWLNLTSPRGSSPTTSPKGRRKRTLSVNF